MNKENKRYGLSSCVSDRIAIGIGLVLLFLIALIYIFGLAAVDKRMEEAVVSEML
jgi:hypothetical protein